MSISTTEPEDIKKIINAILFPLDCWSILGKGEF